MSSAPQTRDVYISNSDIVNLVPFQTLGSNDIAYKIDFDKTQWKITTVAWSTVATQTYSDFTSQVADLLVDVFIESQNPYGSAELGEMDLKWGAFDAGDSKKYLDVRPVFAQIPPDGVDVKIKHQYKVDLPPLTGQTCNFSDTVIVTLEAIVQTPTNNPTYTGSVKSTSTPPPVNWGIPFALGSSAVIVGGLVALALILKK